MRAEWVYEVIGQRSGREHGGIIVRGVGRRVAIRIAHSGRIEIEGIVVEKRSDDVGARDEHADAPRDDLGDTSRAFEDR